MEHAEVEARLLDLGQPQDPRRADAEQTRAFPAADAGLARSRIGSA